MIAKKRLLLAAILAAAACILYVVGLKWLVMPVFVGLLAAYLPMPAMLRSGLARVVVGTLLSASILQVAATVQFLVWPASNFVTLTVIASVLHVLLIAVAPRSDHTGVVPARRFRWVTTDDALAFTVVLCVLLPFTAIFIGNNSILRIAEIGGIQAIDATNHYAGIAEVSEAQHLTYAPGYYYPKGFHIAAGFVQDSLIGQQAELGWRGNVVLYFAQYMVLAVLAAYMWYYLVLSFLVRFTGHVAPQLRLRLLAALSLAPVVALLYLLPFIAHGFLNYFYVCATVFAGIIFLLTLKGSLLNKPESLLGDVQSRWQLFAFLLLIFGASVSWPLLVPPLTLIGGLLVMADTAKPFALVRQLWSVRALPVIAGFLLQLVPVYFQLAFSGADASQGINSTGGLRAFHGLILLGGALLMAWLLMRKEIDSATKRLLFAIFMPLFVFIGLLVCMQYFMTGEIRYYAIKSSLLLEMLLVAAGVALFVQRLAGTKWLANKHVVFLPLVPLTIMLLLVSVLVNPLKDVRDLFRDASGQEKPAMFDHDISVFARLGTEGKLHSFNATLLHYSTSEDKFFAHMQIPFWANMMQYSASKLDFKALHCTGALYSNLAFGGGTATEQAALLDKIATCAHAARERGVNYYIVTDEASAPYVSHMFGDLVKIEY